MKCNVCGSIVKLDSWDNSELEDEFLCAQVYSHMAKKWFHYHFDNMSSWQAYILNEASTPEEAMGE